LFIWCVLAAVVQSCGSSSPTAPGQGNTTPLTPAIEVSAYIDPVVLGVGESGRARSSVHTTGLPTDVSAQTTWVSLDPAIATVTPDGIVRAVGRGTATITGRYQGVVSTPAYALVISGDDIAEIILTGSPWNLKVGQPAALGPRLVLAGMGPGSTIYDVTPANRATYTSSDPTVAPIDANGVITTVKPGEATLSATFLGKSATVRVVIGTQDQDEFKLGGGSVAGRLGIDSRVTYGSTFAYWLVSAASGVITHHIVDQNGRELGSNMTAVATSGGPKTVDFSETITPPAGTTRVCTSATLDLSTGTRLTAAGGCDTAR
jgi:hypothetical protein